MKTLIVEDDTSTRQFLERILVQRGNEVTACADAESAWEAYQRDSHPIVLLDWLLPGMDGLELCRRMRSLPDGEQSVILVFTARSTPEDLDTVLKAGADDYITKPVEIQLLQVRLAIAEHRLRDRWARRKAEDTVRDLRRLLDERARFQGLVGKSRPMQLVYEIIQDVARVDTTVLIEGETGTGKELVARAIHARSHRSSSPFVAVNCAGLTESLLASQLFGHRRGAFTGAVEDHQGFFEEANKGTLFLDEIGDIPPSVQTNLLRALQEREIMRVGDSKPRKIDVRVLVATHRNLNEEVTRGAFRPDLLYRIRVARIQLPPLRSRREDIPLLAAAFLEEFRATSGKSVTEVSHEAMRSLLEYHWPGNVRELRSAVEFAMIRCKGNVLEASDLPPELLEPQRAAVVLPAAGTDEGARINAALAAVGGNRTDAARLLGISRATLYRRLAEMKAGSAGQD